MLDAELLLHALTEIRKQLPAIDQHRAPDPQSDGRRVFSDILQTDAVADFEERMVIEALESLVEDVHAIAEQAHAKALAAALEIYYALEDLARDPANAELIPQVEMLRRIYEREYGTPIPPKPPTEES